MKKKDERIADLGLKQIGVTPLIYHFESQVEPFTAITVADDILHWSSVRHSLNFILPTILPTVTHEKATRLRLELAQLRDIYGVSICDGRDQFNRQRGRTIAKGRLLKHLKGAREGVEKEMVDKKVEGIVINVATAITKRLLGDDWTIVHKNGK